MLCIRGVVADDLVSYARDPGINSNQHHMIHDIWHHVRIDIVCLAAICAADWFLCMIIPEPTMELACVLGQWAIFYIT